jgi:diguanylate cyclase (GGDEF)-like protein
LIKIETIMTRMGSQLTKQILSILLVALVTGLILFVDLQSRTEALRELVETQMQDSVSALKNELKDRVDRTRSLAQLFAREQSDLIQRLYTRKGDKYLELELEQKVRTYFPDYFAFTLADAEGVPVLPDLTGKVGKGCRRDLSVYAEVVFDRHHVYVPHTHFNMVPDGFSRHFDVMVPWVNEETGIFFVSIRDSYIQESMLRHERQGFDLILLSASDDRRVELRSNDGIVQNKSKPQLTDEEYSQVSFLSHVEGTLWDAAAIPDQRYISAQLRALQLRALYLWLIMVVIAVALVSLWRREAKRRAELSVLNAQLGGEIETRKQTESELRKLTNYDPLTTLPNRKSIDDFLGRALAAAEEEGRRPAVLFFDLDRFQEFNDTLGHGYGDVMLKEAADRLKGMVGPQDLLARWGGDEFVIVMHHVQDENEVAHFANELLLAMRKPIQLHRQAITATISIGISLYPEAGKDAESLLKNADLAMYRAKNEGRDRFRFFLQEMDDIANERIRLESEIRDAIRRDEFEPYFQPRMDMERGVVVGCEALMRWHHPKAGLLTPGAFLMTLEETGMIEAVGDAVRAKVCSYRTNWAKIGNDTGVISINLGGKEFIRPDIVGHLAEAMLISGLQASQFEIEITEGYLMENTADSLGKLHALKNMGFKIAIDDFGTGYSSLAYLKRFPVDVIKVDQSFVSDCVTSPEDQEIIRAIITLAHSLDLRVVAEGVETVSQMEVLRGMGCDELQGYFIGKPMSADQYLSFIIDKN